MEIVAVDGYLVVYGGEAVGFAYGMRDERGVVDSLRHITLIAGEDEQMVEVEIAGL